MVQVCASAPFGNDRRQAGKRSDMKHYLFLGVFPVTRKKLSNGLLYFSGGEHRCVLEFFGPRCMFLTCSNASHLKNKMDVLGG